MKGRDTFTSDEVVAIRKLLRDKVRVGDADQKSRRSKLRRIGFYIEDFALDSGPFRVADFDVLLRDGRIKVKE